MIIGRIAAACVLSLVSVITSAADNEWTAVGPHGGSVLSIQYQNATAGVAIAATDAGIYRTENDGQSWTRVLRFPQQAYGQGIAVNPANRDHVLLVGPLVYRSVDGGVTWNFPSGPPAQVDTPYDVVFSHDGAAAWLSDLNGRVFRSIDEGASWQDSSTGLPAPGGQPILSIEVDAVNANIAYARSGNGRIYRTTSGGTNWTELPGNLDTYVGIAASPRVGGVLVGLRHTMGVFQSTNHGDTWTPASSSLIAYAQFGADAPGSVLGLETLGRVHRSLDAGLTWTPVGQMPVVGTTIAINPTNPDRALVGTAGGIFATTDAGATWTERSSGIDEAAFGRPLVAQDGSGAVYAPTLNANMIYRRNPGTGEWQGIARGAVDALGPMGRWGDLISTPIGVQPSDSNILYVSRGGSLVRSTNGGGTWHALGSILGTALTFDPTDPLVGYAATSNLYLQKTVDGGANWTPINNGLPATSYSQVLIHPTDPQVLYAAGGVPTGVYRSTDAGASWAPANTGIQNVLAQKIAFEPGNATVLYAATTGGLFKSTNSGGSWTSVYQPTAFGGVVDVVVDSIVPTIVYATAYNDAQVLRSVDAGQTWERLQPFIVGASSRNTTLALLPAQPSVIVAAKEKAGLHEMRIVPILQFTLPTVPLFVGTPQTADLSVRNAGPYSAVRVQLTATLPAASGQYSVVINKQGCTQVDRQLECLFDVMRPGEIADVKVSFTPANTTDQLTARTTAYGSVPGLFENNLAQTIHRRVGLRASLGSNVTSATVGDSITYTLMMTNDGPSPAVSVRGLIQLPQNTTFVSASGTGGATCAPDSSRTIVNCEVANLAAGASAEGRVTVTAAAAGTATTYGSVSGEGFDTDPANDSTALNVIVQAAVQPPSGGGGGGGGGSTSGVLLLLMSALSTLRVMHMERSPRRQ